MRKSDLGGFFTFLVALAHGVPAPPLTQFGGWKKMTEREIAIDTPEFEKLTMARVSRRLHTLILFMLKWNLNFAKVLPAINYISPFFPRYLIGNCPQKVCNLKMIQLKRTCIVNDSDSDIVCQKLIKIQGLDLKSFNVRLQGCIEGLQS